MKADTWMPLYVSDYLKDTMKLTTELHGAYFLLLLSCWTEGGQLLDEDVELAAITKMTPSGWRRARPVLARYFQIADGVWRHKRVTQELEKAQRLSDIRREQGAKGGRPRKKTNSGSEGKAIGFANPNQNGSQTETPSPSPIPVPSERSSSDEARAIDWGARIGEAIEAGGDALNLTIATLHSARDLRPFVEPVDGEPCTWDEVLEAIRLTAARQRQRGGKPITSWSWIKDDAWALRDARLKSAAPPVAEGQTVVPFRSGPPTLAERIAAEKAEGKRLFFESLERSNG